MKAESKPQKRIKLVHGSVRVDEDVSEETVKALNKMAELAYNKVEVCSYCKGSKFDPYPNHDTTMRPCPHCQP